MGKRGTEGVEGDEKKVHLYVNGDTAGLAASPPHRLSGEFMDWQGLPNFKEP